MSVDKYKVTCQIEDTIRQYANLGSPRAYSLVPHSFTLGRLYEAHVLALVVRDLAMKEGITVTLINSKYVTLKSGPGPINRNYPHFSLHRHHKKVAELWTDVEFTTLSYSRGKTPQRPPQSGEYHELDILVTDAGASKRPRHDQVWLAIEYKNTRYTKKLLREILGVRRELSLFSDRVNTKFSHWPRTQVRAAPPSCLMVYSTDSEVHRYSKPGDLYGIDFVYEPL